jgi:folate-binding protein YgfZ
MQNENSYRAARTSLIWTRHGMPGIIEVRGTDIADFLNRMSTNQIKQLDKNQGIQTVLTNEKGRIIDCITLLNVGDQHLLLCSARNEDNVIQWMKKYIIMDDVKLSKSTQAYTAIALHGPQANQFLAQATGINTMGVALWHSFQASIAGSEALFLRIPPLAELGYLLLSKSESLISFFENQQEIPLADQSIMEILRIESGAGIYGKELSDQYNPLEAGLLHLISFRKGCYIGQEVIARLDSYNKVQKRILGLKSSELLTEGSKILCEDKEQGIITSSVYSIDYGNIALGYIRSEFAFPGSTVQVRDADGNILQAELSSIPFGE